MQKELKGKILKSLETISEEEKDNLENSIDLFNLLKVVGYYEELEPDIRDMLNRKARKDKWRSER